MAANGLLVLLPIGRPLGVVRVGGRDTFGERDILDGCRERDACAATVRDACHGWKGALVKVDDSALCWQNRHNVCVERDMNTTSSKELMMHCPELFSRLIPASFRV